MSQATADSPETRAVVDFLQAQSTTLRSSAFATATIPISTDDALADVASFKDKVVVITGAAGIGFGAHYSKKVASYGAKVVLSDLQLDAVQRVVDEIKAAGGQAFLMEATGIACNVLDWDAQRHAIDTYGKIDIVFANAGTSSETAQPLLSDETDAHGEPKKPAMTTLDVNCTGAIYTVKLGFYHLSRNPAKEGKSIVILGSMASFFGIPGAPLYTASKHAVLGFMRSLYHNAKSENIAISTINPFFCLTGIFGFAPLMALAGIPLATMDDVIAAMIFASSHAGHEQSANEEVNGSSFLVDWKGILQIPYNATSGSSAMALEPGSTAPKGYYKVFEDRASNAIYTGKVIKDIISAVTGLIWGSRRR
ncbi:uncharacterized protein JCM15063_001141 [Sporobolomyces koalae]|uniref:uncharacterized protein n=1 Tax=Sporobolomyces koalae TaxID=500713 RepID=UPI00317054AB